MAIKIYNSLSKRKERLPVSFKKKLNLFACGPTVYDYLHIGNARTNAFFDTLARFLRSENYKLFYLQNITDIDDKIINRAFKQKTGWKKLANKFETIFRGNMQSLNITSVDKYANATKFIPQIARQIKILIEKGHAYEIKNDGYYFDIKTFKDYGKLSGRTIKQAEDGVSRIDNSKNKKNAGDFCLWKFSRGGEPSWNTTLGKGRPGWHIEDTAISEEFFGPQYHLHGAGVDLKFPHHEAEIAQQESISGKKPFVRIWMHVGMLTAKGGKKMSKSLNNFITINEYLKKHSPNSFRIWVAGNHYRSPMEISEKSILDSEKKIYSIQEFISKLNFRIKSKRNIGNPRKINTKSYSDEFISAMSDDINTPKAMAAIFMLINDVNNYIWNLKPAQAKNLKKMLCQKLEILGVFPEIHKIPKRITALLRQRELFRSNKQFIKSDALRKKINALGYKVEDTPIGPLALREFTTENTKS